MNTRQWETIFVVFALLFFTGPFIPIALRSNGLYLCAPTTGIEVQNKFIIHGLTVGIFLMALFLLGARRCFAWSTKDKFLLLLLVLVLLSVSWSESPAITFQRALALVGTLTVAIFLAVNYTFEDLVDILGWTFGIAILLSFLVALALPDYGVMSGMHEGAWRGIYPHKNGLGRMMALSGMSFLLMSISRRRRRVIGVAGALSSLALAILSQSMTGLLVLVLLAVLVVTFMMMRRHPVLVPALVIFVMVFAAVFVGLSDGIGPLLKTIGRDSTFTGRIDLWESAALVIQKSPWVGHGYGTAWVTENQENVSTDVSRFSKWDAPDSHNGFLNLALDLGLLGLAVFAVGYMVAVRRAFVFLHATETIEEMWPILFLAFCLLTNITEGALIKNNTIDCLLYITTVLSLARKTETFEIREMLVSI